MRILLRSPLYAALCSFALLFLVAGVLLPMGTIVQQAFFPGGAFSLEPIREALGDPRVYVLLARTLALGVGTSLACLLIGIPFAWLLVRSDLPAKSLWRSLGIAPVVIPPLVLAIAWSGYLHHLEGALANIFIFTLAYTPIVIVLAARAFEQIDANRLLAARLAGGERALLRIALGLARPQILIGALLVFVFVSADFAVPDFVAAQQSVSRQASTFNVYASEIFSFIKLGTQYPQGAAASLPLALLIFAALAGIVMQVRRSRYATVDSGFQALQPTPLGRWKIPALLFVLAFVVTALGLPIVRFIYEMKGPTPLLRAIGVAADASEDQNLSPAFLQSLLLAASGATVALIATAGIAHFAARRGRSLGINLLWIVPLAFPGIAYAIGMVCFFSTNVEIFQPIRQGPWALILNLAGRFLPFTFFALQGSVLRTDPELEEAALVSGVPPTGVFTRISLPLMRRGAMAGWILAFLFGMREIDSFTLLSYGETTIMRRIYEFIHRGRSPEIAAGCLVLIFFIAVPLLLHSLLSRRRMEVL